MNLGEIQASIFANQLRKEIVDTSKVVIFGVGVPLFIFKGRVLSLPILLGFYMNFKISYTTQLTRY